MTTLRTVTDTLKKWQSENWTGVSRTQLNVYLTSMLASRAITRADYNYWLEQYNKDTLGEAYVVSQQNWTVDYSGYTPEQLAQANAIATGQGPITYVQAGTPPESVQNGMNGIVQDARYGFQKTTRLSLSTRLTSMVADGTIKTEHKKAILSKYDEVNNWVVANKTTNEGAVILALFAGASLYLVIKYPSMTENIVRDLERVFWIAVYSAGFALTASIIYLMTKKLIENNFDIGSAFVDATESAFETVFGALEGVIKAVLEAIASIVGVVLGDAGDVASNWWDLVESEASNFTRTVIATVDKWVDESGDPNVAVDIASISEQLFKGDETSDYAKTMTAVTPTITKTAIAPTTTKYVIAKY